MSPSAMLACPIVAWICVAESGKRAAESMTTAMRERSRSKRSKRMRQPTPEVSTAAVSLMYMVRSLFFSVGRASSISIVFRWMPGDEKVSCPIVPCRRMSPMKSVVFTFASFSSSASITTLSFSSGQSCTSTTARLMSAMVSPWFTMRTPSTPRSRGKSRSTCSTVISIPVASEA